MMKILVLGANGMVGHVVALYLQRKGHQVTALARKAKIAELHYIEADIRDLSFLYGVLSSGKYDAVVNCVGVLNQMAESDKENAIFINALLPHVLAKYICDMPTHCIQISTDCVFSGERGNYEEQDIPDGQGMYSRSKYLGELNDSKNLTFRTSVIGPDINKNGIGLLNWFMQQKKEVDGYIGAIWTGVTSLTLAQAVESALIQGLTGIYHLVNSEKINKYELLQLFNHVLRGDDITINSNLAVQHDKSLICTRKDFAFTVPCYLDMVSDMRKWIIDNKDIYSHYEVR